MILIQPILYIILIICYVIFFVVTKLYKNYYQTTKQIKTPDQALHELLQGNKSYNSFWNFTTRANRKSVAITQRPFAIILSCSDSRVPTEIIFNQLNLGSLFIIRNAGNVVDKVALGSIEYGVSQLGALLLIVLGHDRCGAITTTIETIIENKPEASCNIKYIINALRPSVFNILKDYSINHPIDENLKKQLVRDAVKENVRLRIQDIYQNSEIIEQAISANKIKIIGAYYDLDDGNIEIIA